MLNSSKRALIIGGGIAGPVLAVFLKQAGFFPEVFEASSGPNDAGGALGLAPNGMNVLAAAGIAEKARDVSVTGSEFVFENQRSQTLGRVNASDIARYGQPTIMITRAALHRTVVAHAEAQGIPVHYNKRLVRINDVAGRPVVAHFADGTSAEADFIVGADGIGSQVRQAVMPEAPKPVYTGMMAPGGFSPCLERDVAARSDQPVHFIFGQNGFFGYFNTITSNGPQTLWWSTAVAPRDTKAEMSTTTKADIQKRLLSLHGDWAQPVPQLIESATDILNVAIHDVPNLPRWTAGRTVLIGDAAHAVAPHSGQGASMALEDAQYLAQLLRDSNGAPLERVFADFELNRRPRTDKVIALGRRNGQKKETRSPVEYWIQQQMVRLFVPLSRIRRQDWLLGYKVEQSALV